MHAWLPSGYQTTVPILVTITKMTATQITAVGEDGSVHRFRERDRRRIGSGGGSPELRSFDADAAAQQLAARTIDEARLEIFHGGGQLISPRNWSDDPTMMAQIADELALFLARVQALGVSIDRYQREWLEQHTAVQT